MEYCLCCHKELTSGDGNYCFDCTCAAYAEHCDACGEVLTTDVKSPDSRICSYCYQQWELEGVDCDTKSLWSPDIADQFEAHIEQMADAMCYEMPVPTDEDVAEFERNSEYIPF